MKTGNLIMVGLGVRGDTPLNSEQHPLVDGIHLRWSFKRELGFPWHGFYLFRRPHTFERPVCLSDFFGELPPGPWYASQLSTPYGPINSDANFVLTEDFPSTSKSELDLRSPNYLHFEINQPDWAFRVKAKIGFKSAGSITVTVLAGEVVLAEQIVTGQGEIAEVNLFADSISGVRVSGGNAVLVDLCLNLASQEKDGWEQVPGFPYPMSLPVMHPNYPCNAHETNPGASWEMARKRVLYGSPDVWAGAPFDDLYDCLLGLVADGPDGVPMALQNSPVEGVSDPPDSEADPPQMIQQYPLDLVLSASLHPAIAQMVGLYWVDRSVPPDEIFDYLILAIHRSGGSDRPETMLHRIQTEGLVTLDQYIVFGKRMQPATPLASPENVRCYSLPGGTAVSEDNSLPEGTNNAGVRWDSEFLAPGVMAPDTALMYHVWRCERGTSEVPEPPGVYTLATPNPVLVPISSSGVPARPPDWPPFSLHFIDSGLNEGWYSYRVNGIDIFGRHSVNSADARWFQWEPEPRPRPWYYQMPPADIEIHPSAVRLLDKIGPPTPQAVEAYALDPADPTLVKDALYDTWFNGEGHQHIIGLRVRWQWTESHMRQAPDTREFRIYLQPDYLNSFVGRITAVSVASDTETYVDTDISNLGGADAYVGCWLRVGPNAFAVVRSSTSTLLTLRVRDIGPEKEIPPSVNTPCTLTIPRVYNTGSVSVKKGSTVVTGTNTRWITHLVGMTFKVLGQFAVYRISAVNSETELVLDRPYAENDGTNVPYGIRFPLFRDFADPVSWHERFFVVPYDQHVTLTVDGEGRPLRKYELIIPAAGEVVRSGLQLEPSLSQPIRYAHVGVSAADDKNHTTDDSKWATGNWGGPDRFGNEGPVSSPAKIFVVHRTPPPPPPVPPDSERVFASPADYHSHSFYTYRWIPSSNLKTHIFRALDDTLFQTDWERRADVSNLDPNQTQHFPPDWDLVKREQVANELNHLNTFNHAADKAQAMSYYRALSNDGLRTLAGLSENEETGLLGNERAFTQITIQPLDPNDAANANRLGPDNPADYVIDPSLRAHIDTLDGRSTNRYFYRAAYVDGVHNRGPMSLSSPPVWLPNVVPPRTPVITKVLGGDRQITLKWASNREPDLAEYVVYRAKDEAKSHDPRLMNRVGRVAPSAPNTASVEWVDTSLEALTTYYYRLVAVDIAGNISAPSLPFSGRAYDDSRPAPPIWDTPEIDPATGVVTLYWSSPVADLTCIVQRSPLGLGKWLNLSGWLGRGVYAYADTTRAAGQTSDYRLRVMDAGGRLNNSFNIETI